MPFEHIRADILGREFAHYDVTRNQIHEPVLAHAVLPIPLRFDDAIVALVAL
jgi:hypothetical protein